MPERVPPDPALVRAVQAGDLQAFETFYRRYETGVYRASLALVRDDTTAQEVVIETFLRAYRVRARLDPDRCPLPWLQKVAVNLSMTHLRRRRLGLERLGRLGLERLGQVDVAVDRTATPEAAAEDRETAGALARGIDRLPVRFRVVVVLRFVEELSLAEIAEVLECPLGTVKSRLHYGLRLLRADLEREEGAAVAAPGALAGRVPGALAARAAVEIPSAGLEVRR